LEKTTAEPDHVI